MDDCETTTTELLEDDVALAKGVDFGSGMSQISAKSGGR